MPTVPREPCWGSHTVRLVLFTAALLVAGCSSCGGGATGTDIIPVELPIFDAAAAFADLEAQCNFGPRLPGSAAHQAQLAWMISVLTPLADQLVPQPFPSATPFGGPYDFTNLIAAFSVGKPGPITLIGAHWDTRPVADEDPDPALRSQPVPGANDGASGVAILLELARILHQQPPPTPVYLACFDAEDSGRGGSGLPYSGFCLGSAYMAQHWPAVLLQPDRVVVLDLVGGQAKSDPRVPVRTDMGGNDYFDLRIEPFSEQAASSLVTHIWDIAAYLSNYAFQRTHQISVVDDHVPFINAGIPAVDVVDFPPPVWHTVDDTPEYCSPNALLQVGQTMLGLIYGM